MCRLFGFRSNVPSGAHDSLVAAENALARQAEHHGDGWGIGYFSADEAYILKSEEGAANDEKFDRISRRLESNTFVVHVRRATIGGVDYLNSHPFRYGNWVFAHNGTIFGFDSLRPRMLNHTRDDLKELIFGSTDSEHLFYYIVSALHDAGIPDCGRDDVDIGLASKTISTALGRLFSWSKELGTRAPLVNFILTNGRQFFAQQAGIQLWLASQKTFCNEHLTCAEPNKVCLEVQRPIDSLWVKDYGERPMRQVNHVAVASERMGDGNIWEAVPEGALVALDEAFQLTLWPAPVGFRVDPEEAPARAS